MYIPNITSEETLFGVYIALPEPYENYIRNCRINHGDSLASLCPTHITLLPPTAINRLDLINFVTDLKNMAASFRPFWVKLDGVSSFKPVSNVSFINVVKGNKNCASINNEILSFNSLRGLDKRFDYHPHVTIGHGISQENLDVLEKKFKNFTASFICSKICVDILDTDGSSRTVAILPLGV